MCNRTSSKSMARSWAPPCASTLVIVSSPPIFAQAAKSDLLYVAAVPASADGILLPAGSTVQTLRDLKGKRIAYARGSSAHNLTIAAVEKNRSGTDGCATDAAGTRRCRGGVRAWGDRRPDHLGSVLRDLSNPSRRAGSDDLRRYRAAEFLHYGDTVVLRR